MGKIKAILFSICLVLVGAYTLDAHPLAPAVLRTSPHEAGENAKEQLREKVAMTYTAQIGVMETDGPNWGPEIREYLRITNISFSAPWCAAFVSYCYTVNGVDNPRSAWSPSYFSKSRLLNLKYSHPLRADVFGVWYNNLGRIAHIGFIDRWPRDGDYFISVEGNTNDNGSREGNGVYKKRTLKRRAYKIARYI